MQVPEEEESVWVGVLEGMGFRVCYWMVWKGDLVEVDNGVEAVSAAGYQAVNGGGGGGGGSSL